MFKMTSLLDNLRAKAKATAAAYLGDDLFLAGAAAAAALVAAADGTVEASETEQALTVIQGHKVVAASYRPGQVDRVFSDAIARAKTRGGRMENLRAIGALVERDQAEREDVFMIAADVADAGTDGLKADERKVLGDIATALRLNAATLLGE